MYQSNHLTVVDTAGAPTGAERRGSTRVRTVYRVARITAGGDQGLARVHNISDEGLMITTMLTLCLGDVVQVDLSDDCRLTGEVIWHCGQQCGLRLMRAIDCAAILRCLCEARRSGESRPLRLMHSKRVVVASQLGLAVAAMRDVSQAGMKIAHDGRFDPGLAVKVMLKPGVERRGVVRWSRDGQAGIALTEGFSVAELGSMRSI